MSKMNNILRKCNFCLYSFASILVIYGGVSAESRLHPLRSRRQSEGKCHRLKDPAHGKYVDLFNTSLEQQLLPSNSVLWFVCNEGYQLYPKNTLLICLRDGSWSQDPPTCSRKCPAVYSTATTKVQCFDKQRTEIKCDEATDGSVAEFECATNFVLSDIQVPISICWSGSWNQPTPQCMIPACPPPNSRRTQRTELCINSGTGIAKVQCFDKDQNEIKCDEARDHSTAKFECAPFYEPAEKNRTFLYRSSGSWSLPATQCIPVCGEKVSLNVQTGEKGNYPWVTAVFQKTREGLFRHSCSGSMLTQKIILIDKHCVVNGYGEHLNLSIFKVGVGKYYNDYMNERDTQAQYSDVEHILLHTVYKDGFHRFESDMAFLVTKDTLILSEVVQPVCFRNLPNILLTNGSEGIVTGWSYTADHERSSEQLKDMSVSVKDGATCIKIFPPDWLIRSYDILCTEKYKKSLNICRVDNGGGLVFKNPRDGRFYVHGIVSEAVLLERNSSRCGFSLFTKVAAHYDWLEQIVSQYT